MKANELRIGNLVLMAFENVVEPVTSRRIGFINQATSKGHSHPFEPIPLSEEWLIKFGFEGDDDERHIVLGFGGGEELSVELLTKTCCLTRTNKNERDDYVYVAYPEYVHQLQNLYFSLTGKELKYDEE
ncbi:hypothetical protein [Pedobacter sp. B4-66]|uniref:hypothetical protein n=1 Tax=Pedobacter sp. B4-66 TaxID=2817280 RepID=UPI001BDB3745|nr:hypothetical protein [Pedobacter sp. B4-66]